MRYQGSKPVPAPGPDDFLLPVWSEPSPPSTGHTIVVRSLLVTNHTDQPVDVKFQPLYLRLTRYDQRFLTRIGIRWRY